MKKSTTWFFGFSLALSLAVVCSTMGGARAQSYPYAGYPYEAPTDSTVTHIDTYTNTQPKLMVAPTSSPSVDEQILSGFIADYELGEFIDDSLMNEYVFEPYEEYATPAPYSDGYLVEAYSQPTPAF